MRTAAQMRPEPNRRPWARTGRNTGKGCSSKALRGNRSRHPPGEEGFTLVEVLLVVALIIIMTTVSMLAFRGYARSNEHRGAVRETVALLRSARTTAVSEAVTTECEFAAGKLDIYRETGASRKLVRTYMLGSNNLQYVFSGTVSGQPRGFADPASPGSLSNRCFFYPRGSAAGGTVGIKRLDKGTEYKLEVEGLTGRVAYCADPTPATPCPQ